jgi:hypothetical protein
MSHFSTIKTKIKDKEILVQTLELLGYDPQEEQELKVSGSHGKDHPTVQAQIAIGTDIGFRWNDVSKSYELVTDLQTWDEPVPVERFLQKLSQQYARWTIHEAVKEDGFEVVEEWEMEDNSIELTVTRWV